MSSLAAFVGNGAANTGLGLVAVFSLVLFVAGFAAGILHFLLIVMSEAARLLSVTKAASDGADVAGEGADRAGIMVGNDGSTSLKSPTIWYTLLRYSSMAATVFDRRASIF